ncbi:hypothetical protein D6789_03915 [Candidatus Woesearchaeota archaeon]|nr:MAG: hypothetical protein D6789_03915 [Candidatus Woesearchaeota archaeon]
MSIPHEKKFHFKDGTAAGTLQELKDKIETISYDEFYGHVNDEKNDFANWVEGVLGDSELATRMRAVKSIVETVELLNEKLYPEETERREALLQERREPDIQAEIERKIFGEVEAPREDVAEDVPEIVEPAPPEEHPAEQPHAAPAEQPTATKEPELSKEEVAAAAREAAHVPITRVVQDKLEEQKEEALRRTTKEFVYGLLLGIILGFVLGVIIRGVTG